MNWISAGGRGVILNIHAVPRSSRNAAQGLHGDALKVRLQAPPVEGRANEALVRFLAETLDIPRRQVTILAGAAGRRKRVLVEGLGEADIRSRLGL